MTPSTVREYDAGVKEASARTAAYGYCNRRGSQWERSTISAARASTPAYTEPATTRVLPSAQVTETRSTGEAVGGEQHRGHVGGVSGQADHAREVVAAAGRHDPERAAEPGDLAGDRGDHAVATDGDHHVVPGDRLADQVEGGQRTG